MNIFKRIFTNQKNIADDTFNAIQPVTSTAAGGYRAFRGLTDFYKASNGLIQNHERGLTDQCIGVVARYLSTSKPLVKQIISQTDDKPIPEHPFSSVLLKPNNEDTTIDILYNTVKDFYYYGDAYWYCRRSGGVLLNIYRLPADKIQIQQSKDKILYILSENAQKSYTGDENKNIFEEYEIIRFNEASINSSDVYGKSKVWTAGQYIDVETAILRYIKASFDNAVNLGKAISPKEKIAKEAWAAFVDEYKRVFKTANNAEKDILTDIELTIQNIGQSSKESSYIKTLEIVQKMIMGHFEVPPFLLGRTDSQYVGSNIVAITNFINITIEPLARFMANEIDKYVKEYYGSKTKFVLEIVWPKDKNTTTDKQDAKELYELGLITENELLAVYGRPKKKDGDKYKTE